MKTKDPEPSEVANGGAVEIADQPLVEVAEERAVVRPNKIEKKEQPQRRKADEKT